MNINLGKKAFLGFAVLAVTNAFADYLAIIHDFYNNISTDGEGQSPLIQNPIDVGTVIMWGNATPPEDWVLLDGGSTDGFPMLQSIYRANVPDLSNQFIRGFGGSNTAALGAFKADSFKSHNH